MKIKRDKIFNMDSGRKSQQFPTGEVAQINFHPHQHEEDWSEERTNRLEQFF
jgi:hypothetical protein